MNTEGLAAWLSAQRWFAAKTRRITSLRTVDEVPLGGARLVILEVGLDDGTAQTYLAPLHAGPAVGDALDDERFCRALLALIADGGRVESTGHGELHGQAIVPRLLDLPAGLPVRRLPAEQSNTSVLFGRALLLKVFRRHVAGTNPEVEIGRFLTERVLGSGVPRLAGLLEYRSPGQTTAVAIVQEFVDGARDGWQWMLEQLAELDHEARTARGSPSAGRLAERAAPSLAALRRLGEQTAALHRALASVSDDRAFVPSPITADDLAAWSGSIRAQVAAAHAVLGDDRTPTPVPDAGAGLAGLLGRYKIRHHGDFHLGQTLYRPDAGDFVIIDFEGEPVRSLDERRCKHAAARDVAGLLRSLDYAVAAARRRGGAGLEADGFRWAAAAEHAYLAGYRTTAAGAPFLPATDDGFRAAVTAFELEKAAYEVVYEANHRPDWIDIPRRGLHEAATRLARAGAP